jgi:hypothetical protein
VGQDQRQVLLQLPQAWLLRAVLQAAGIWLVRLLLLVVGCHV